MNNLCGACTCRVLDFTYKIDESRKTLFNRLKRQISDIGQEYVLQEALIVCESNDDFQSQLLKEIGFENKYENLWVMATPDYIKTVYEGAK